jgi:hypothetical protein
MRRPVRTALDRFLAAKGEIATSALLARRLRRPGEIEKNKLARHDGAVLRYSPTLAAEVRDGFPLNKASRS